MAGMHPTFVKDAENLSKMAVILEEKGFAIVYESDTQFSAYENGKKVKLVKVRAPE